MIRITLNRECLVRQLRKHARFQIVFGEGRGFRGGRGKGRGFVPLLCEF